MLECRFLGILSNVFIDFTEKNPIYKNLRQESRGLFSTGGSF